MKFKVSIVVLTTLLSIGLLLAYIATLFTVSLFPIYPDEIQTRISLSRLIFDTPYKISGAPYCASTFLLDIPLTNWIPSLLGWIIHGWISDLETLRLVGFIIGLAWFGTISLYLVSKFPQTRSNRALILSDRLLILGMVVSLMGIGVFPFFVVTNRAEQLMLPGIAALAWLFIHMSKRPHVLPGWRGAVACMLGILVATSLISSSHPKGLFFLPAILLVAWQFNRRFENNTLTSILLVLLAIQTYQHYSLFTTAFSCKELQQFESTLKSFSIQPGLLFQDPMLFIQKALDSVLSAPKYLAQLGFQHFTDIGYLPAMPLSLFEHAINIFIKTSIAALSIGVLVAIPYTYWSKDLRAGIVVSVNLFLVAMIFSILVSVIFNIPKNWYDGGYIYFLIIIIGTLYVGENYGGALASDKARLLYLFLGSIALMSQINLAQRYIPPFLQGFAGPSISLATHSQADLDANLATLERMCHIDPVNSQKLIVDDQTYLHYKQSRWPMAITYLMYDNSEINVRRFLARSGSDGLVTRCSSVPSSFAAFVQNSGNYCCISKEGLRWLEQPQ